MNKITKFVFALFTIAAFSSCGPTSEDAINYNDSIIDEVNKVVHADNAFIEAFDKGPEDLKTALATLLKQVDSSIESIKKGGGFDKGSDFMDASVKYLTTYKGVVQTDYQKMVDISSKADDQKTEEDDDAYNKAQTDSQDKMKVAEEEFTKSQHEFAKKYKFKIKNDTAS